MHGIIIFSVKSLNSEKKVQLVVAWNEQKPAARHRRLCSSKYFSNGVFFFWIDNPSAWQQQRIQKLNLKRGIILDKCISSEPPLNSGERKARIDRAATSWQKFLLHLDHCHSLESISSVLIIHFINIFVYLLFPITQWVHLLLA